MRTEHGSIGTKSSKFPAFAGYGIWDATDPLANPPSLTLIEGRHNGTCVISDIIKKVYKRALSHLFNGISQPLPLE